MQRRLPDWVSNAVFYQIFPDRFREGNEGWHIDPLQPADRTPRGGTLNGILAALPYLEDLGVNALYLTPIFRADSYHKYDTIDYFAIDPALGDETAFRRLVQAIHDRGFRLVLDGVFNHCSRHHPYFLDVVERGSASPYWDWFTIRGDRVETSPEPNYARWAGVLTMPEWNHAHPQVVDYLLSVVRYWIEEHDIDGWRLDTTEYLPPDFVRAIYRTARESSPNVYILGEVMGLGTPWFRHDAVDGVMHYKLWEGLAWFLAEERWDAKMFAHSLYSHWHSYPEDGNYGSYTLLSSHDRPRFLTLCGGETRRFLLALAFQMTFPGAPAIYYGDEVGLQGGDDPDNRRPFPWNREAWNLDILEETKRLVHLRRSCEALRSGALSSLHGENRTLTFERRGNEEDWFVALNASRSDASRVNLPPGEWSDPWNEKIERGAVTVPALAFRLWRRPRTRN